jgi:glycerol-3-phosphate acyltransferase PlsY
MSTQTIGIVAAVVGYLAGSITGARIMGRGVVWRGTAVTVSGTGATATVDGVSPSMLWGHRGARAGTRAALIDIAKGIVPTAVMLVVAGETAAAIAATAVVVGHVYPLYHRFHGGFGMSPMIGALLVLDPVGLVIGVAAGVVLGVAVGSAFAMTDLWPLPYVVWASVTAERPLLAFAVVATVLYVARSMLEMRTALTAWRTDPRPWRRRVADIRDYPHYAPAVSD